MELREQFTLAPGVSQSMTAFKAKPGSRAEGSPNSSVSGGQTGQRPSISGPITKVIFFVQAPLFFQFRKIRVILIPKKPNFG